MDRMAVPSLVTTSSLDAQLVRADFLIATCAHRARPYVHAHVHPPFCGTNIGFMLCLASADKNPISRDMVQSRLLFAL